MPSTVKKLYAQILALSPDQQTELLGMMETQVTSRQNKSSAGYISESSMAYQNLQGRQPMQHSIEHLLEKLASLPTTLQAEVEDFIDFLHQRELRQSGNQAITKISESTFNKIWDNDEDATYDKL